MQILFVFYHHISTGQNDPYADWSYSFTFVYINDLVRIMKISPCLSVYLKGEAPETMADTLIKSLG